MKERRQQFRVNYRQKLGIQLSSGQVVYAWTRDVSLGGMQIVSEFSADIGDRFQVFMSILDPSSDQYVRIDSRVRIVHVVFDGVASAYRIGLQFEAFGDSSALVYERFIESLLKDKARLRVMSQ